MQRNPQIHAKLLLIFAVKVLQFYFSQLLTRVLLNKSMKIISNIQFQPSIIDNHLPKGCRLSIIYSEISPFQAPLVVQDDFSKANQYNYHILLITDILLQQLLCMYHCSYLTDFIGPFAPEYDNSIADRCPGHADMSAVIGIKNLYSCNLFEPWGHWNDIHCI